MRVIDLIDVKNFVYKWDVIEAIPQFAKLKECEQSKKWHGEGTAWEHTKRVCEEAIKICATNRWVREKHWVSQLLASALFHDIGQGVTTEFKKGDWHSYGHEVASEKITRELLWEEDTTLREEICSLVRWHMEPLNILNSKTSVEKILYLSTNIPSWMMLINLKTCDMLGSIAENEEGKKNDIKKLDDLKMITSHLNCYYTPTMIPYMHQLPSNTSNNGKKSVTVHLMMGLPGSGKSTELNNILSKFNYPFRIVSRDIVRAELGFCKEGEKYLGTREEEDAVTEKCKEILLDAAEFGETIFIDDINLKRKYRDFYHDVLKNYNVTWIYHYVETNSIETNVKRREGQIAPDIVRGLVRAIEWPSHSEYNQMFIKTN